MSSKFNFPMKKKTSLALLVLLFSSLLLCQVTPSKAKNELSEANQLVFPLHYKGQGISTDSQLNHYLFGDTICPSTATWEINLYESGSLHGSYINTNPKAANNGECVSTYDEDHPSSGINRIDFSGIHSDGHFEITGGNLHYDYTHSKFRGHDKNIEGYYDANHIYISPVYRHESNTYSNWTDVFEHEFDLPEVSGPKIADDTGQDGASVDDAGQETASDDNSGWDTANVDTSGGQNPMVPIVGIGAVSVVGAATVAGATAVAVSRGKNGSKKEKDKKKKDPCLDDLNRLKEASIQARSMLDWMQTLRWILNQMDVEYENLREATYLDSIIDLGFLGGAIFAGPAHIARHGIAVPVRTVAQGLGESVLASLGSDLMKSVSDGMLNQGISWESLLKSPYNSARNVATQKLISGSLTEIYMRNLIQQGGLEAGSSLANSLRDGYQTHVAGHIASGAMQALSAVKIVRGLYTAQEKLDAILKARREISMDLFETNLQYEDAISEIRSSRRLYENCKKLWSQ